MYDMIYSLYIPGPDLFFPELFDEPGPASWSKEGWAETVVGVVAAGAVVGAAVVGAAVVGWVAG